MNFHFSSSSLGATMSLPERETDEHLPDPPEFDKAEPDECRVWIGNLDQRINEWVMKFNESLVYDFLFAYPL